MIANFDFSVLRWIYFPFHFDLFGSIFTDIFPSAFPTHQQLLNFIQLDLRRINSFRLINYIWKAWKRKLVISGQKIFFQFEIPNISVDQRVVELNFFTSRSWDNYIFLSISGYFWSFSLIFYMKIYTADAKWCPEM